MSAQQILKDCKNLLNFNTSGVSFSLPLEKVERIIPLVSLVHLPNSPNYICGLLNLHGEPIPAVDTALLFNSKTPDKYNLDTSIIICRSKPKTGLIVTEIVGVTTYEESHLSAYKSVDDNKSIIATASYPEGISYVIDVDWLVEDEIPTISPCIEDLETEIPE